MLFLTGSATLVRGFEGSSGSETGANSMTSLYHDPFGRRGHLERVFGKSCGFPWAASTVIRAPSKSRSRGNPTFGFPLPRGTPLLFPFPKTLQIGESRPPGASAAPPATRRLPLESASSTRSTATCDPGDATWRCKVTHTTSRSAENGKWLRSYSFILSDSQECAYVRQRAALRSHHQGTP
jgi:hypothetical protein